MKYLYNFSWAEVNVVRRACIDFRNSSAFDDLCADDKHALDSIISYCNERIDNNEVGDT